MNPDFDQEIEASLKPELPEAPLSIHIDAYYKGFHTGITIRSEKNGVIPTSKIVSAVNSLIAEGFEPSWNKSTSNDHLNPDLIMEVTKDIISHPCAICAEGGIVSESEYKSGVKKTTGKPWAGWFCKRNPEHVTWTKATV